MSISKLTNNLPAQTPEALKRSDSNNGAAKGAALPGQTAVASASVKLSMSETLKSLAQEHAAQNNVDEKRVAELRQAIASGTFTVDAEKVAAAMIEEAQLLQKPNNR
jgi:negative regulator of flagellin synthesis FlgM